jgi:hypothetical protein
LGDRFHDDTRCRRDAELGGLTARDFAGSDQGRREIPRRYVCSRLASWHAPT